MTRVAVTTTADAARRVGAILIGHGLVPIGLPCIAISPSPAEVLDDLRERAVAADLIVVTSARAVTILWPQGGMPATPVAAVGQATADAARVAAGTVQLVGSGGAADLAATLDVDGLQVVFPHARAADPTTTATLEGKGATVFAAPAYDTVPIAPDDDPVAATVFGSPSAVEGWLLRRALDGLTLAAMGPTTATALRARGFDPVVTVRPDLAALAAALAERITR